MWSMSSKLCPRSWLQNVSNAKVIKMYEWELNMPTSDQSQSQSKDKMFVFTNESTVKGMFQALEQRFETSIEKLFVRVTEVSPARSVKPKKAGRDPAPLSAPWGSDSPPPGGIIFQTLASEPARRAPAASIQLLVTPLIQVATGIGGTGASPSGGDGPGSHGNGGPWGRRWRRMSRRRTGRYAWRGTRTDGSGAPRSRPRRRRRSTGRG